MRPIIDSHVHLCDLDFVPELINIADDIGAEKMGLVSISDRDNVNDNPVIYKAKAQHPHRFYAFAALDHSEYYVPDEISVPSYAEQIEIAMAIGVDGIKLLETKPDRRKKITTPIDSHVYDPMFALLERDGFPLVWHVADPEEFWDPDTTPGWAKENDWGYNDTFVPKEQFYTEVGNVLKRHPMLKVAFAHFYFLSADLKRAAELLDTYKNVHFDLAPGIEMLYNLSRNVEASRDFFIKYKDRIIFGTDIGDWLSRDEAAHRAGMVNRWLETADEFRVPAGADYLLGPPTDGIIHGMSLPAEVLQAIYVTNFEKLAGPKPNKLDHDLVEQECNRIAELVKILAK